MRRYTATDFWNPILQASGPCTQDLRPPYRILDPDRMHTLVIAYLLEQNFLPASKLSSPPQNIADLIRTCSLIFSPRISRPFRKDMEAFCRLVGEDPTKVNGVSHSILIYKEDDMSFGVSGSEDTTLEQWVYIMVVGVCKAYNKKMERQRYEDSMRVVRWQQEKFGMWKDVGRGWAAFRGMVAALGVRNRVVPEQGRGVWPWMYNGLKIVRRG